MGIIFFMLTTVVAAAIIGVVIMIYADTLFDVLLPFIFIIIFTSVTICILGYTPTAIDVYRNKTTLEITYKDGIAIDSTVVFKDKKK